MIDIEQDVDLEAIWNLPSGDKRVWHLRHPLHEWIALCGHRASVRGPHISLFSKSDICPQCWDIRRGWLSGR